jgi:hypothetical protein
MFQGWVLVMEAGCGAVIAMTPMVLAWVVAIALRTDMDLAVEMDMEVEMFRRKLGIKVAVEMDQELAVGGGLEMGAETEEGMEQDFLCHEKSISY